MVRYWVFIALCLVYCQLWYMLSIRFHEVVGVFLIFIIVVHMLVNYRYMFRLWRGTYNGQRKLLLTCNILLLLAFIACFATGIIESRYIFKSLDLGMRSKFYKHLHEAFAYMTLGLVGLHLLLNRQACIIYLKQIFQQYKALRNKG